MAEKKQLDQDQLDTVDGGARRNTGYFYGIQYTNNEGYGRTYTDGPFESLEIAKAKLEEKKNELIENGCVIKNTQVIYHE